MVQGQSGKGDQYRPQSAAEKRQYDINYLRVYGDPCPNNCVDGKICQHVGVGPGVPTTCPVCNGLGYIERSKT